MEKENKKISTHLAEIEKENQERIVKETKRLFIPLILSKCSELTIRKFIKLSIHLIKCFHKSLARELSVFKTTNVQSEDLINAIYIITDETI